MEKEPILTGIICKSHVEWIKNTVSFCCHRNLVTFSKWRVMKKQDKIKSKWLFVGRCW